MKQHLDYDVLSALQEVMEDEYPLLLDTFLKDSQTRIQQLREADTAEKLGHAAHSFKGSSSNMGAFVLADLCHELEERVKYPPLSGIEDLINRIDQEFKAIDRLFRNERLRFPC
ncbi:Hpt domain-containing protein [Pseudomonas sp. R5(2019)]|uniref:Hpt domain-containing protein n=1 Tax=Pseudomonas sp. R5(2019) TaxID=2697566 RepID=UPI0014125BC2|nr:Hpt domain-containing protein [Pseudomonas sp. R5(2019)]